jgi:hypothetical protein
MRHVYGVALALLMAAAVFFDATWGYLKITEAHVPVAGGLPAGGGSLIHYHAVLEGGGALLAVGLLAGLLIAIPWFSPLASGLPGLALLAWSGLYLFNVKDAVRFIPLKRYDYGAGFETLLFTGLLAAAGLAMIIPLFIPSRWRGRQAELPSSPPDLLGSDSAPTIAGYATPAMPAGDSELLTDWSQTRPQPQIDPGPPRSQAPWGPADYS